MRVMLSGGRDASRQPDPLAAAVAEGARCRGRGRRVAAGVMVVLAAGGVAAWRTGVFGPDGSPGAAALGSPPAATATVMRRDLAATTPVTATLGYEGSYLVTGRGGGTLTWLPSPGQVIRQGQVLYRTDNASPVALLNGRVPDWRALYEGITGQDVSQLNHDLVNLGYADRAEISALGWNYYSGETAYAVQRFEGHLGVSWAPGSLSLGQVVFEPQALRVSQLTGSLGGPASGTVLAATSDRHAVTIQLSASQESAVAVPDAVTVTLPDGARTPGTISSVGTVASGTASNATVQVTVTLTHPSAAGSLDQAPVTVDITTATADNVLVVPVTALLAQSPGSYEVEVVEPGNMRRYVPVTTGIIDDADGLVQVTGALASGQRVVVAAT